MKNLPLVFGKAFVAFFLLFTISGLIHHFFFPVYMNGEVWPSLERRLLSGLTRGLAIATLITVVQVLYIRYWAKVIKIPAQSLDYGTHQRLEMEVGSPLLSVFQDLKDRLAKYEWTLTGQDANKGFLQFKVSHKWQIPADLVTIRLEPTGTQKTLVKVDSKMNALVNLIDNAHNLRNVYRVRLELLQ